MLKQFPSQARHDSTINPHFTPKNPFLAQKTPLFVKYSTIAHLAPPPICQSVRLPCYNPPILPTEARLTSRLRSLPSIDAVLQQEPVRQLVATYSHEAVVTIVRRHLDGIRYSISNGDPVPDLSHIVESVCAEASWQWTLSPRRVINATGVVLHTNLGRAPLSKSALQAMNDTASGYSDLEFELRRGQRGSRQAHVNSLITQVSGAEAALVVNNNASAVMLGLAALARNKEVIVSRGEAVEIGGGFRIPGVLAQSGARLVEVGATNRTYLSDYESAINEETGAILKVHASNFRISGFTHSVEAAELVALGRERNLPVLHDLGSGCLLDVSRFGLAYEPTVQDSISAGCGLSFFSGDKLLGGAAGRHNRRRQGTRAEAVRTSAGPCRANRQA